MSVPKITKKMKRGTTTAKGLTKGRGGGGSPNSRGGTTSTVS